GSGNDEHVRAVNCAQALYPMNQLERYSPKILQDARQATTHHARTESPCSNFVDCFRGKSRNVVSCPHIPRICAETLQLRIGPAPQDLFDDGLKRTFIAQIAGAEVPVETDFFAFHEFTGQIEFLRSVTTVPERSGKPRWYLCL